MLQELWAMFLLLRQSITFSKILRNSKSISVFKEKILNFIPPSPNFFFDHQNPKGIKIITRLRLVQSHLREHKFKHSFIESSIDFFLHFPFFINGRRTLVASIRSLDSTLQDCNDYSPRQTLLFGSTSQVSSRTSKPLTHQLIIFH